MEKKINNLKKTLNKYNEIRKNFNLINPTWNFF